MMVTVCISGASDDLLHVCGVPCFSEDGSEVSEEVNVCNDGPHVASFRIEAQGGSSMIRVHCIYAGYWAFAVGSDDGDYDAPPAWEVRRSFGDVVPYSETLSIDVPDDARVVWEERQGE